MATYQNPYQNSMNPMSSFNQFQLQQMFPQPQGSVYSINSPLEIGNVPIGSTGLSVALCLNEGLMYIKSFQNNSPVIMTYHITPHTVDSKSLSTNTEQLNVATNVEGAPATSANTVIPDDLLEKLKQLDTIQEKLNKIETQINQGGKFSDLL